MTPERQIMNSLLFVDVVAELGRLRDENERLKSVLRTIIEFPGDAECKARIALDDWR